MYKFTITRYGDTGAAIHAPRKTEAGAERWAWNFCRKHGLDGDLITIYKRRGKKPLASTTYRIDNYRNYPTGASNMKEELVFGKPTGRIVRR